MPDTFTTSTEKLFDAEKNQPVFKIELHPNPVSDILTLEWNSDEDARATISIYVSIYDLTGRQLLTSPGFNTSDEKLELNVSSLPPGFYFATINFGNTKQQVPFIKQ